ncbi:glycosyltransferase [Kaistia terrae]|uniref:Glycosyltransferase n=1 Tax=Kaistia terrae TaxID=537017 RepID=A0ABW0PTZ4_9HYPH|nr:glycosyltransferase [Kaistia terrae]MCX5577465.1 glycosyltransferase [Kaistia terrae]
MRSEAADLVVIAMPLYGHAALAVEALETAFASRTECRIEVVVSVDGDPRREVFDALTLYAATRPELHVIFGPNAGPGGARNRAIDFIVETLPDAKAVYFLDADNRVLPTTIETLYERLKAEQCGWVYTNIDTFSVRWGAHYGDGYSRLTHCVADNICDTGSMISIDVFHAGVRFDADRQNGFEDWEFWLSCIEAGFVGVPCHDTAFEYRLRAESRFKEANRDRAASVSFLRRRHKALFRRSTLVDFEHEEAPRYAMLRTGDGAIACFTDPTMQPSILDFDEAIRAFWGSAAEPDNFHFPPFLAAGSAETLKLLQESRLWPNLLVHLERATEAANVVFVQIRNVAAERGIDIEIQPSGHVRKGRADLVFMSSIIARDAIQNNAMDWFDSIAADQVWPTVAVVTLRFPFPGAAPKRSSATPEQSLINLVHTIATSPLRTFAGKRWTWRGSRLPALSELYKQLRTEIGGAPVLPLGHAKNGKRTLALLVPNASFGGAEKVAFAAARELKAEGFETHLFVLGSARMDVLDEFDASFDYIHFWKQGIPAWGGTNRFLGQDFIAEYHDVDWNALKGVLSGFDLIINNHVMAVHPLMARLRSEGARTACYLHVVDETSLRRPAGQPFAAIAHEHCYDAFLTCSEQLKVYLHSYGVPLEKIYAVANAPSISVKPKMLSEIVQNRQARPTDAPLRILYMGRFEPQKGIDRIHAALQILRDRNIPFEALAVGGEILADQPSSWTGKLRELGVTVRPPIFSGREIATILAWGDILIMPSRWEGAPLMIAEAQLVGCVPVATAVGAVDELVTDGRDGILIEGESDLKIVADLAGAVELLARDRARLGRLRDGGLFTASGRSWAASFGPFVEWCDSTVSATPRIVARAPRRPLDQPITEIEVQAVA